MAKRYGHSKPKHHSRRVDERRDKGNVGYDRDRGDYGSRLDERMDRSVVADRERYGYGQGYGPRKLDGRMDRSYSYERNRDLGGQNYDPQSGRDANILNENRHKHANLPQNVIMGEYPMAEYADFPYLDDTIRGIDNRMYEDKRGMNRGMGDDIKY